jgi:cytoskeletal protein CcmA (bactofilin family)
MTTIGPSLTITGEITSQEDIMLNGRINGQIRMESGALVVAQQGRIDAEVHGTTMTIQGALTGSVTVETRLELMSGANVTGTLKAPTVVLQDGATFNGTLDMPKRPAGVKNPAGLKIAAPSGKPDVRAS